MKRLWLLILWVLSSGFIHADPAPEIKALSADNHLVTLNAPGFVTVVISSSPQTQEQTRATGRVLDRYRGRADFRLIIVVDLRGSIGSAVPPIVRSQMRGNLDQEAERLRPFYVANGNTNNPRADMEAIPDFKGATAQQLDWKATPTLLRVVVFGKEGEIIAHWDDLTDNKQLDDAVTQALEKKP